MVKERGLSFCCKKTKTMATVFKTVTEKEYRHTGKHRHNSSKKLKTFLISIPPPGYNWFVRNLCLDPQNMYFLLSSYDDSLTPFITLKYLISPHRKILKLRHNHSQNGVWCVKVMKDVFDEFRYKLSHYNAK